MTNQQSAKRENEKKHTLRRVLLIILALIILLFIFTSAILGSRLAELAGRSERPVLLEVGKGGTVEIFKIEYENGNGEVTVRGAKAQKLVAPGTENTSFVYYANADTTAIDYTLKPGATFHSEEYRIPLEVRLIGPDGNYIVGSADAWEPVENLNSTPAAESTIGKGKEAVYTLEWKWAFRSENPEDIAYDTLLGDAAAAGEDVGLEISFTTQATANTSVDANGGFAKSGMLGNVVYGILWILLLIALILLIIALIKGKDKKDPTAPVPPPPPPPPPPKANKHHVPPIIPKKAHAKKESFNGKMEHINLDTIEAAFAPGERVTLATLKARGMLPADTKQMKILARNGETLSKPLIVETQGISSRARHLIIAAGGQVIITKG